MKYFPIINASELPSPRLELRWGKWDGSDCYCDYNLVFTLGPYDIRHKKKVEYTGKSAEKKIRLGRTKVSGGRNPNEATYRDEQGRESLSTPFRDGAHIRWDGHQLGLRAFVVAGDRAQELNTKPKE